MKKFWPFFALFPDLFPSSPVPTSEYQLMMFVSWLAQSLSAASVDVYLAAVRSYHIDWGNSDPTENKPRLRRVLQGIRPAHGAARSPRRPIIRDILGSIHRILSISNSGFDCLMFWSACLLAFFGLLRVTSLRPLLPSILCAIWLPPTPSLCLANLHPDSVFASSVPKAILLGLVIFCISRLPVPNYALSWRFAPISAIAVVSPAPYSSGQTVVLLPLIRSTIISALFSHEPGCQVRLDPIASASALRRRQLPLVSPIILSKCLVVGQVRRIVVIFVPPGHVFERCPAVVRLETPGGSLTVTVSNPSRRWRLSGEGPFRFQMWLD